MNVEEPRKMKENVSTRLVPTNALVPRNSPANTVRLVGHKTWPLITNQTILSTCEYAKRTRKICTFSLREFAVCGAKRLGKGRVQRLFRIYELAHKSL